MTDETVGDHAARRGRRPGNAVGRGQILAAATTQFGEHGYLETTIRMVGKAAGVDAKLVHYYFGTKEDLFTAVIAEAFRSRGLLALLDPGQTPPDESPGTRYVDAVLTALEDPGVGPGFVGLVRSIGSHEESKRIYLRFVYEEVLDRLAPRLPGDDASVRIALAGSHLLGLVMARYVLGVPPLADLPREDVARAVGPVIDRYILGDAAGRAPDARTGRGLP